MTFVWDSDFEAYPSDNQMAVSQIDNEIRAVRLGIWERMSPGHNWGPYTEKDDGSHRGGYVQVMDKGDAAAMAAVSDPQEGCLFLVEDGSKLSIYCYYDAAWNLIGSNDHGELTGLTDDDHAQYLKKDGGLMEANLNMGSNFLIAPLSGLNEYGSFTLYGHRSQSDAHGGDDGIRDEAVDGVTNAKIKIGEHETSGTINPADWTNTGTFYYARVAPTLVSDYIFLPQVCWTRGDAGTSAIFVPGEVGSDEPFAIHFRNDTVQDTVNYRIRLRYVQAS